MCGRYVRTSSPAEVATHFGVDRIDESADANGERDYNIAPRQEVLVVRDRRLASGRERVVSALRWGLVPQWASSSEVGDRRINARAETVSETPSFSESFRRRRCIVVADGFYEWQTRRPSGAKQPVYFSPVSGRMLAFAGLWSAWRAPNARATSGADPWLRTCLILTTPANATVSPVHHRMPAVLGPESWDRWLDPRVTASDELLALLEPASPDLLSCVPVGTAVNRVTNNGPELLRPVAAPTQLGIV